ncbi:hypothetical protein [Mycolicibacterium grossiae]|uniref:Uncharacterized protein n=1 Tax=Mycolicibacterium grossiae TaxID=1552759 RepID=A0A1E8Q8T2_9MYCO|nr:hypothetical protein [Mycolicibacterium grossiae]OFJ54671.1 hypothetical protein BEL07_05825 [Mycolicibacterium grossiae]QEM45998.1 hypothetical protein FZ046_15610 [Mycolicibacterium grossiae]
MATTNGSDALAGVAAALVAVGVLVAGPGLAVASGDPGSRHSSDGDRHSHSRADRHDSAGRHDRGERGARGASRDGHEQGDRGPTRGEARRGEDTARRGGSGPRGSDSPDPTDEPSTTPSPTLRVASRAPQDTADREQGLQAAEATPSASPATSPTGSPTGSPPAVIAESGGGGAVAAVDSPTAPTVVFGNGRVPGEGSTRPADPPRPEPVLSSPDVVLAPVVVADPPTAPVAPVAVLPPSARTDERSGTPVLAAPPAETGGIGALWGLAGLLLAPLAGIGLGYRQARAHRAAAELTSSLG